MKFARESYSANLVAEMAPLWKAHYEEIAAFKDIPLDPDLGVYSTLDKMGALRIYTVRDSIGSLHGYEIVCVRTNPHYRTSLQANQDILYLCPSARKGMTGYKFIRWVDDQLSAEGVQVICQHVKSKHDFGPVLKRMGYKLFDQIYARRLD